MSDIITTRDIDIVTAEIQTIKSQTRRTVLAAAIEIGRRLVEAKSMLPHGEWGAWLETSVDYSQSTANNLMAIFREYGDDQTSLFDKVDKSETFGKLTYTQALALLEIPREDRAEFVEQNHVEDLSTRELQQRIREAEAARDAADHDRREALAARDAAETAAAEAEEQRKAAGMQICELTAQAGRKTKELKSQVEAYKESAKQASAAAEKSEKNLLQMKKSRDELAEKLRQAKENPEVPADMMEQLRRDAEVKAAETAAARADKEVKKAEDMARQAKDQAAAAQRELEEVKAQLATAQAQSSMQNPDVAVYQELFNNIKADFHRMQDLREKVRQYDRPKADNLQQATVALFEALLKKAKEG